MQNKEGKKTPKTKKGIFNLPDFIYILNVQLKFRQP